MRKKRALRVRKKLRGTSERPRLCIVKSNAHIHVQVIDDGLGRTLVGLSTNAKQLQEAGHGKRSKTAARALGEQVAQRVKEKQIERLVLDRGPSKYTGVIAELANTLREAGLEL